MITSNIEYVFLFFYFYQTTHLITIFSFLDRVLSPVLEALVPMKTDIQQNVGRIVLKTFCDAWLEHIRNKKIKFR